MTKKCNQSKIIKKPIPYIGTNFDGDPMILNLNMSLLRGIDKNSSSLIEEAINFYNYGIEKTPLKARVNKKEKIFPKMDKIVLEQAIYELRIRYHDSLKNRFISLLNNKNNILGKNLDSAQKGIIAVRTSLSDKWRNDPHKGSHKFLKLEQVEKQLEELRKLIAFTSINNYITPSLISSIGNPNVIYGPTDMIAMAPNQKDDNGLTIKVSVGLDDSVTYSFTNKKIGLTERLYSAYSSEYFHPKKRENIDQIDKNSIKAFEFLDKINEKVAEISKILPFGIYDQYEYNRKLNNTIWKKWFSALDILADEFGCAIQKKHKALGITTIGEKIGLPWALIFIGVLKVYLLDLMLRTLMGSLPIYKLYNEYNGNAGIALLEALSAREDSSITYACLDRDDVLKDKELVKYDKYLMRTGSRLRVKFTLAGTLQDWMKYLNGNFSNPWNTKEWYGFTDVFKDMHDYPIIKSTKLISTNKNKQKIKKIESLISIDYFKKNVIYNFPTVNEEFYEKTGMKQSNINLLNAGICYFAQAHLYVAAQLLRKAKEVIGLQEYKDFRENENFKFGDSSLYWGGKFPPHATHRDGRSIDLNFGPYIVPWPLVSILSKEEEKKFYVRYKEAKKQKNIQKNKLLIQNYQNYQKYKKDMFRVCDSYDELKKIEGKTTSVNKIVYRPHIKEAINCIIKKLRETKKIDDSEYQKIESQLIGTPHFQYPDLRTPGKKYERRKYAHNVQDIQMTHIGHLAILLSAPTHIIFASPIVHLRAIYSLIKSNPQSDISQSINKVLDSVMFTFLPHNHHNHWHVEYRSKSLIAKKNQKKISQRKRELNNDRKRENAVIFRDDQGFSVNNKHAQTVSQIRSEEFPEKPELDQFKENFPLWHALGIDFGPFLGYLKKIKKDIPISNNNYSAQYEIGKLIEVLEGYGDANTKDDYLKELFKNFSNFYLDNALNNNNEINPSLKPTIKNQSPQSEEEKCKSKDDICKLAKNPECNVVIKAIKDSAQDFNNWQKTVPVPIKTECLHETEAEERYGHIEPTKEDEGKPYDESSHNNRLRSDKIKPY